MSNKDKATIPIIALTANAFEEDRKKAVAQGMNGHISKPIDVNKIEKVLLSILK
ncbi:response regulator [Faecalibacillus intestinalis]